MMDYNSSEQAYQLLLNSDSNTRLITISDLSLLNKVKLSFDLKLTGSSVNEQIAVGLNNNGNGVMARTFYFNNTVNKTGFADLRSTVDLGSVNYAPSTNTYYTMEVIFDGSNVTLNLKQNNNVVATKTITQSVLSTDSNQAVFYLAYNRNSKVFIKNISVKAL